MPILTFLAVSAASFVIGKVVEYAAKKIEGAVRGGETFEQEESRLSAEGAKATDKAIIDFGKDLSAKLKETTKSSNDNFTALGALESASNRGRLSMLQIVNNLRHMEEIVDRGKNKAMKEGAAVEQARQTMKDSMTDFSNTLRNLNDVEVTILAKVAALETDFKEALKLGLAEHEAWKSERSILRFFEDFKLHREVAEEVIKTSPKNEDGKESTIDESPHIQAFIKAMRNPLNGITTDLSHLRTAYKILDADETSSRNEIYTSFRETVKDYGSGRITYATWKETFKVAFDALTGSYAMAVVLICQIAPSEAYQTHYSQEALIHLEEVAKKMDDCLTDDLRAALKKDAEVLLKFKLV